MLRRLRQYLQLMVVSLRSLGRRWSSALMVVIASSGVIGVLLGLLAMSSGIQRTLVAQTDHNRGLILRNGSNSEMDGWLSNEELNILQNYPQFSVFSPEIYATVNLPVVGIKPAGATPDPSPITVDLATRGVTAQARKLRPGFEIVAGRDIEPGKHEALVGIAAASRSSALALSQTLAVRGARWRIVGHFRAAGALAESELWVDLAVAKDVFRRDAVSLARVALAPGSQLGPLNAQLQADPTVTATAVSEPAFFAQQARQRSGVINVFAYLIAGIMACGAVAAIYNTMHTVVHQRRLEIATLRALGFDQTVIVSCIVSEGVLLSLAGAALGTVAVAALLDGHTTQTENAGVALSFAFALTPPLIGTGLLGATLLGLFSSLLPARHAVRFPLATALRGD